MSSAHPLPSPPAVAAFLRGIERRAAVLAQLQAGDAAAGDAAVVAAMAQWHAAAADMAMSEWPQRFWALLLAQPQLRVRTAVALPLDATDRLGELGAGPRAALLLRLAAGLDEATAAVALGVPEASYRLALQGALPRRADGTADEAGWQRLRDQVHRRVQALPAERLARLARARDAVVRSAPPASGSTTQADSTSAPSRDRPRVLVTLWALLALCAAALAASFLPAAPGWLGLADSAAVSGMTLLPDAPPASRYGKQSGLIAHRDFALLADPTAQQARDLAFHSWLAAQPALLGASPATVAAGEDHDAADGNPGEDANAPG